MTLLFAEFRARRALARLLSPCARIGKSVLLQRRSHSRIWKFELEGVAPAVLKWKQPSARVDREARNLRAMSAIAGLRIPRLLGSEGPYLAQEFLVGRSLSRLHPELSYAEYRAHCFPAMRALAAIHSTRDPVLAAVAPRERMTRRALQNRLQHARTAIEATDLARARGDGDAKPGAWRAALSPAYLETLVADLHEERPDAVLGHGDFHPDNLLVAEDAVLAVLDWGRLSLATPWCDLAHPLLALREADRAAVVDHYLAAAQARGLLAGLEPAPAYRLARSGMVYSLLMVAKRLLRSGREPRGPRARELGGTLDAISALVG